MKPSIYNHIVHLKGRKYIVNTLTHQLLLLSDDISDVLNGGIENDFIISLLSDKGFLVNNDVCEKEMVKSFFLMRKYSSRSYNLIVNTTLDCNLGCWYCYETHIKRSFLPLSLVTTILNHLKIKSTSEPFKVLNLGLFGGEPMMNYLAIKKMLEGVKALSEEFGFKVNLSIVTNGTYMQERYVDLLKGFTTRFQITIDGDENMHNSVRKYKSKSNVQGSYETIINGLKLFNSAEADFYYTIRINYDSKVLANIDSLINDLDFLNRKRTIISLHRIWQYSESDDDCRKLLDVIERINNKLFVVDNFSFSSTFECCYADSYNQALINYNGDVFKCTARDFMKTTPDGRLNSDGFIEWSSEKVDSRLNVKIPQKCLDCSLLPSCSGICSQQRIEATDINSIRCPFEDFISKENRILFNIKQKLIAIKNETFEKRLTKSHDMAHSIADF